MHLLYLDDSGSVGNASDKHIILAGVSVHELKPHWLSRSLDEIAERLWPSDPRSIEFHGSEIITGKKHWRGIPREQREEAFCSALRILSDSTDARLFGAVVDKSSVSPSDPMEYAFEQVCSRFDQMLGRFHKNGNTQRGLLVLDKSTYETSIQKLALDFKTYGHKWGKLHNLADVPLFVDSRATRMVQFADLIAYALRKYYENKEDKYFNIIKGKFDAFGGTIHGLTHRTAPKSGCPCPSCLQRIGY